MADLSGADILGGVAVTVSGDLGPLRADLAQAGTVTQTAAKAIEQTLRIKVTGDTSGLQHTIAQATAMVQNAAKAMATAATVKVPINFDITGLQAQAIQVRNIVESVTFGKGGVAGGAVPYVRATPGQLNSSLAEAQWKMSHPPPSMVTPSVALTPEMHAAAQAQWQAAQRLTIAGAEALKNMRARHDDEEEDDEWGTSSRRRGGSGGGGGGGLGGRGFSRFSNPFSNRGIARALGSGFALYGGEQVMNVATGLANAQNFTAQRASVGMQDTSSANNAANDPFLQTQAKLSASSQKATAQLEAWSAIPVAGSIVRFVDALAGTTASLKDEQIAVSRAVQFHNEAIRENEQFSGAAARMSGSAGSAARADTSLSQREIFLKMQQSPGDSALWQQLNNTQKIGRANIASGDRSTAEQFSSSTRNIAAAGYQLQAIQATENGDTPAALRAQYQGEHANLVDAYAKRAKPYADAESSARETLGEDSPEYKDARAKRIEIQREGAAEELKQRAKANLDIENAEREMQARLIGLQESGFSARLRATQQNDRAEINDIKAAAAERLTVARNEKERTAIIEGEKSQIVEATARQTLENNTKQTQAVATQGAARLRMNREFFEASKLEFDAQTTAEVANAQQKDKATVAANRAAQRDEMVAAHDFQIQQQRNMLTAEGQATKIRDDESAPMAIQDEKASIVMKAAGIVNEIASADPENKRRLRGVRIDQLRSEQKALFRVENQGFAVQAQPGMDLVGDPLGILPATQRRDQLSAQYDKALTDVVGVNVGRNLNAGVARANPAIQPVGPNGSSIFDFGRDGKKDEGSEFLKGILAGIGKLVELATNPPPPRVF